MIVVTAPTGNIGHRVVTELLRAKAAVRVVVRDTGKLSDDVRDRVDIVEGSHGDRNVMERALDGADNLFWLLPPDPTAQNVDEAYAGFSRPAAEVIRQHGDLRVVDVTALRRGPRPGRLRHRVVRDGRPAVAVGSQLPCGSLPIVHGQPAPPSGADPRQGHDLRADRR